MFKPFKRGRARQIIKAKGDGWAIGRPSGRVLEAGVTYLRTGELSRFQRIVTAGKVGTSVLYSESPERRAADIVAEFELMRLDDYFAWSRQLRLQHL